MNCRLLASGLLVVSLPSCGPSARSVLLPLYLPVGGYLAMKSHVTKEAERKSNAEKKKRQAERPQREADEQKVIDVAGSSQHSGASRQHQ